MGEALGLIVAAIIAALVAVLGLIISKEQSVSEFRQQWIDALRKDIALLVGRMVAIHGKSLQHKDDSEKLNKQWTELRQHEIFVALNRVIVRIKLRLNPDESRKGEEQATRAVLDALRELDSLFESLQPQFHQLPPLIKTLVTKSQKILKENWNRVREGEPNYRRAKFIALIIAIVLLVGLVVTGLIWGGVYLCKVLCHC